MSKKYEGRKIVLILGAGCTRSQGQGISINRPPLDKNFFHESFKTDETTVKSIQEYFQKNYDFNICARNEGYDSLEYVMVKLFVDSYDVSMGGEADNHFLNLIKLFNRRLANTTNTIKLGRRSTLSRIITHFLRNEAKPENITCVTFNQDIQIEKTLDFIENHITYQKYGKLLNFPYCYLFDSPKTTNPKSPTEIFERGDPNYQGVEILKLHGSLNWYSVHRSLNVRVNRLFRRNKKVRITTRKAIDPDLMKYAGGKKRQDIFPVIIPPIVNKSAFFPSQISSLWSKASDRLIDATDVVIFGYSCPETDHESSNLIQRTFGKRQKRLNAFSIIDPNPGVFIRFRELTRQERVFYYSSVDSFLRAD